MISLETHDILTRTQSWSKTSKEHLHQAEIAFVFPIPELCVEKSLIAAETAAKTILTILGISYEDLKDKYSHKAKTFRALRSPETGKGNPYAKVIPTEVRAAIAFFADRSGKETYAITRYPTPVGTPGERAARLEWKEFYSRAETLCEWKDKIVKGFQENSFIV